jgi:tripartite-type tricarboxylate transporter receptor subunit TctC
MAVSRRDFLLGVAGVGAASGLAFAHDYPSRPIKWLVGYPAGGASDFLARMLAPKLQATVGQPFIVENRTGAAGIIAMEALAKSEADGYTIANTGNGELVFNQALYKKLPYDADKNFALIGTIAKIPPVLVVQPNMAVKNLAELIAAAKERPGMLNYGSGGVGHPNQMSMELFKKRAGVNIAAVSYRGMAPAVQDFLAGTTSVIFVDPAIAVGHVRDGKMKAIAVSTKDRLPALPDIPSMQQQGVPDYDVYAWQGMIAPANTSRAVIEKLASALSTALKDAEVVKRFETAGLEPFLSTETEFAELIRKERALWHPLIRDLNLSLD